jgi:hypothetical protein
MDKCKWVSHFGVRGDQSYDQEMSWQSVLLLTAHLEPFSGRGGGHSIWWVSVFESSNPEIWVYDNSIASRILVQRRLRVYATDNLRSKT